MGKGIGQRGRGRSWGLALLGEERPSGASARELLAMMAPFCLKAEGPVHTGSHGEVAVNVPAKREAMALLGMGNNPFL